MYSIVQLTPHIRYNGYSHSTFLTFEQQKMKNSKANNDDKNRIRNSKKIKHGY